MHVRSHREMENWRNEQEAKAAVIDTEKKVAAMDLCALIGKNINRDPTQCLEEAVRKQVAEQIKTNNNNIYSSPNSSSKKRSCNRNKHKNASNDKVDKSTIPKTASKQRVRKRKTRVLNCEQLTREPIFVTG